MFDIRWRGSPRGKTQTFPTSLGTESHSVSVSLIAYTYWLATAVGRKNRHGTMEVANEPPRGRMVSSITDRKGTGNARLYRAPLPSWLNAPRRNTRRYTLDFLTLFARYCLLGCQRSVHT